MPGPLQGIRVLELAALGPVPFAGMLLADLGADVVRVDRPGVGGGLTGAMVTSPLARGRRSIALDLRRPEAAEVVLRLAAQRDVFVEGFRPGVAERLGVGPDAVLARQPALVYARMTGWGQDGPLASTAGHDLTYLALSGLLHGIGPAGGPPTPPVNYLADLGAGAMPLVVGVLAALLHVRATGEGQVVDAAMVEGASYLGSMTRSLVALGDWSDERGSNLLDGGAPNYRCYQASDGGWVAVGALEPRFWAVVVETLGLPEPVPSPYVRDEWPACAQLLASVLRTRTRDEWAELFVPLDGCVAPVLTLAEAQRHPHAVARRSFADVDGVPMPTPVPRFSVTPGAVGTVRPVDADAADLLAEAGYDEAGVEDLRDSGVLS